MSKAKPFTLLLVRTGSTEWDRENRICGGVDLPLAEHPESLPFEMSGAPALVICGPDECSRVSAQSAADAAGVKVRSLAGLADVRMGLWEGVTHEELEERCPSKFKQWRERPDSIAAPDGEPLATAEDRILAEISRAAMKLRGNNPVLMVVLRPMAHALVRAKLMGKSQSELWEVQHEAPSGVESFEISSGALSTSAKRISA